MMEGYLVYLFLGVFLALSLLIYANLLIFQFFELRFGYNEKQSERIMHGMLVTSLSFMWYSISLSFTLYNKWILQEWHGGFHFPIMITTVHMVMKYFITRVWAMTPEAEEVPAVPWKILSSIVMPIGLCTSADIVFSNIAIQYLPLSIYTTTKGATLVFTFLLGVMCKLEEFQWSLFFAILGIVSGLGLAIASSGDSISAYGLLCVTLSAAASAVRWVLMQLLAVRDVKSESVMVTLFRFSPYSAASIIPFALLFEAPGLVHSSFADHSTVLVQALLYAVLGGVVSFLLIIAEVKLLRVTSSLTMCVIGQIKEIIQIAAAMVLFKDHITLKSGLGIAVSIIAAYWYRHLKGAADSSDEDEEQAATLQILQSSQLAHRSLYASAHGNGNMPGGAHRYVGVNTQGSVPQIDVDDEGDALLFEQEMVHLDLSPAKLRESSQEIEMGQIHQLHHMGSDSGSDDDVEKMLSGEGDHSSYAHVNNGTYAAVANPIGRRRSPQPT